MSTAIENEERKPPNILDVIRMYRRERGMTYEEALRLAFRVFDKRGWPIPESMIGMYNRRQP